MVRMRTYIMYAYNMSHVEYIIFVCMYYMCTQKWPHPHILGNVVSFCTSDPAT